MRKRHRWARAGGVTAGGIALALLAGCALASASIEVKYRSDANITLRRVFVIVFTSHILDGSYARYLASTVTDELSARGTTAESVVVTGMELDSRALPDRMARFQADGILMLKPIGGTLGAEIGPDNPDRYGLAHDVRYLATLFEKAGGRPLWAAEVLHEGIPSRVKERSQLAAQRIVTALYHDHLIR